MVLRKEAPPGKRIDVCRFYRGYGKRKRSAPPVNTLNKRKVFVFSIFTVFTADMVEEKGAPPGKNDKHIKCLIFTVFTADMVEEKGAPPR